MDIRLFLFFQEAYMEISISELKQKTTKILNELNEEIIITKRGRPIAKIVPIIKKQENEKPVLGGLKHLVVKMGDVISPIDDEWEANLD